MNRSKSSGKDVFEILVREHADMLSAYLRSLVATSEMVDDLFQETMLVAWRRLGDYDKTRPFGPWLRGIAVRLVLAQRRKSATDFLNCDPAVLDGLDRRMQHLEKYPADSFHERINKLNTCLERLPERLRDVIILAYSKGMRLRQIATSFNVGEEAIKKRMQRARNLLQQCLGISSGELP